MGGVGVEVWLGGLSLPMFFKTMIGFINARVLVMRLYLVLSLVWK